MLPLQKQCHLCRKQFCRKCCSRDTPQRGRTCTHCRALLKKPPVRAELMELRVKDLQRYLVSRHVNTKSCVGELCHPCTSTHKMS